MAKNKKKAAAGMAGAKAEAAGGEPTTNGHAEAVEGMDGVEGTVEQEQSKETDGSIGDSTSQTEPPTDGLKAQTAVPGTDISKSDIDTSDKPETSDVTVPEALDVESSNKPDNAAPIPESTDAATHKPETDDTGAPGNSNREINVVGDDDAEEDDASSSDEDPPTRLARLEQDLETTRAEKDHLATQYRSLLSKLTTMRQSLGDRLREDAEELDRRESQIAQLTGELGRAQGDVGDLRRELRNSAEECEKLGAQVTQLRHATSTQSSDVLVLSRELRELRGELEMVRVEREEWEAEAGRERERREAMEEEARSGERQRRDDEVRRRRAEEVAEREKTRADNLQEVLAEFQSAKDLEIQQATWELENQLREAVQSLAEWKSRAADAELKMGNLSSDVSKTSVLERELKEKNAQIGRLRHEAVLTQEHLTEALRRLRRNTSDINVDRRLVTNVLLQFIATPRADPKRFEMLSLLATILSWEDTERERAGLQRAGGGAAAAKKGGVKRDSEAEKTRTQEEQDTFNESFSDLFVEFLLKEAAQGQKKPSASPPNHSPQLGGTSSPNAHPSSALFARQRTHSSASISSTNVSGSFPRPNYTTTTSHPHLNLNLGAPGVRSPPYMGSLGQRMQSPGSGSPNASPRTVGETLWQS